MELYFSSNYDTNSLFLLQIPSNLLANLEKEEELPYFDLKKYFWILKFIIIYNEYYKLKSKF